MKTTTCKCGLTSRIDNKTNFCANCGIKLETQVMDVIAKIRCCTLDGRTFTQSEAISLIKKFNTEIEIRTLHRLDFTGKWCE